MKPLNFLFAKLFVEYQKKKDPAEFSITLYISIVYLLILFSLWLPLSVTVNKVFFDNGLKYNKTYLLIAVFSTFALIAVFTYKKYIKDKFIYNLTKQYQVKRINRALLYTLIALIPLFLLLLGGTLTVLISGGRILSHEFEGLIHK
jgi:hypothetical protein